MVAVARRCPQIPCVVFCLVVVEVLSGIVLNGFEFFAFKRSVEEQRRKGGVAIGLRPVQDFVDYLISGILGLKVAEANQSN